jgi:hypothetical protein
VRINVVRYELNGSDVERGHHDWRYDELRMSDRGHLIHEIEWHGASDIGLWVIEASDLEFRWVPIEGNPISRSDWR